MACTPQELAISALPNAPLSCLTRNESIALSFVTEAGVMSFFACLVTYGLILRNVRYYAKRTPGKWRLLKVPMDIYLLSLFAADACIGFGTAMNAKWVQDGKTQIGRWCTAQAVFLCIGLTTMSFNILTIAVHTFVMVWTNKGFHSMLVAWTSVAASWLYSILYVTVLGSVYRGPNSALRPTPYWCWIGEDFLIHRLWAGYIWLWVALFVSVLLYVPLFFWGRGNITVGDKFWSFQIHRAGNVDDRGGSRRRSMSLLAYPLVYSCLVLPLSVGRWIGFEQASHGDKKVHVPASATLAIQTIYALSGICNVILFLTTRPNLLLFKRGSVVSGETAVSGESAMLSGDADSIEGGGEKVLDISHSRAERAGSEI